MKLTRIAYFLKFALITFILLTSSKTALSQPLDSLNITSKIDYILDNSNKYQEFKVVKKTWLLDLKSHISDSLTVFANDAAQASNKIDAQQKEIESLKTTISETNNVLSTANSEKNKISLLGMSLQKGAYNTIMFTTIIVLLILLFVYIIRFRTSNKSTIETKKNYTVLDEEFEQFKKNTLEKEQKLKRQLQDEINKNNRLTNNG